MTESDPSRSRRLLAPLERFFRVETASGIVLLIVTVFALVWANSPWADTYTALWHLPVSPAFGPAGAGTMHFWINEGLMTVFFLLVGLEIRREMHDGALSSLKLAALPIAAAIGGILLPALLYVALARDEQLTRGWAIPTATDIAFAVGVLAVLGTRVPSAVRVLLLALAIIDDIVAILVIAIFYSVGFDPLGLAAAAAGVAVVLLYHQLGLRHALAYVIPGVIIWLGLLYAGIHPTLSGVVLGVLTPVTSAPSEPESPVERLESALHPWVAYGVMPLFALANAGVELERPSSGNATMLMYAVVIALFLGKPVGIFTAAWLAAKSGLGALAPELNWRGVLLVGLLGGIGFTMSIFIANLAFSDQTLLASAKLAVLVASVLAGLAGLLLGRFILFADRSGRGPGSRHAR
jgi:NhaA family Na+:H+ antiporter